MKSSSLTVLGALVVGFALLATAGNPERIGHTTLLPRHSNPDDKGMYTAFIDPTNGYAYVVGTWLSKLDITGPLPVQIGPALNTGQYINSAIDVAAGYVYFGRTTLDRYALGTGTNPVTSAGSLALAAGSAVSVLVDDADPAPTNHYGYVLCTVSGSPARVAKVALSTLKELGSVTLGVGETNFALGSVVDARHGHAYFVIASNFIPRLVKIKMTPGTNPPARIGAVNLDVASAFIDGGSIDLLHGYAYFGTYSSDTNVPGRVYKVKLENDDVPPTLVGHVDLHPGEGRLSASVLDPMNGFVYFANDNTYPGGVYQLSLNGSNLPVEVGYLEFQGTTNAHPPNGTTIQNATTNSDGILPYGEVFIRSAVFDPVRGFAYFAQDSRPNQVVKVRLAQLDPVILTGPRVLANGAFQCGFSNIAGAAFTVLAATNPTLPSSNWSVLGGVVELPPGQFQFADPQATNGPQRYYRVRAP